MAGWGVPSYAPIVDAAGAWGEQKVPIIKSGMTAVFSMHATKALGCGEGGYIVTWDEGAAQEYRAMSNFGFNSRCSYGINAKMSEIHAAFALAALDQWDREPWLQLDGWYRRHLPESVIQQDRPPGVYPILSVKLPCHAQPALERMKELGVECRRWYTPTVDHNPLFDAPRPKEGAMGGHKRPELARKVHLPVTMDLEQHLLGLPYHLWLTEDDVKEVCEKLAQVVEEQTEKEVATAS